MEGWQSGLWRGADNLVKAHPFRGFESRTLLAGAGSRGAGPLFSFKINCVALIENL